MLRSFRMLLLTILVTLSLPLLHCNAQRTVAAKGGQTPLKVEVRLQNADSPSAPLPATALPTAEPTPSPTATPEPTPTPVPTPFSLYWVSDTQVYAYRCPQVFNKVFAYMANAAAEQNALGVLMTGDIVDNRNTPRHWNNAKAAIGLIEGRLPLWCVAGNHDVGASKVDYKAFLSCGFCAADEGDQLYKDGVCWYDTFTAAGQDILLLGIGWQTDTDYLPWAKTVLTDHADLPAILLVHSFLTDKGGLTPMGRTLEAELLSTCPNLRLVLCGHNDGSVRWAKTYEDGHTVNALMYNFQDDKKKGLGYLRILTFDPLDRSVGVTTYSPWFDDFDYQKDVEKDTFTLADAW